MGLVDKDEEFVAKPQAAKLAALPISLPAPRRTALFLLLSFLACAGGAAAPAPGTTPFPTPVDVLTFGDPASEESHQLTADHGEIIRGGLGEPARRLLPREPGNWEGGRLAFTLRIDPDQPNYVTIRLWGSDVGGDRLILYCEGKQIGYRHLGDIDLLDFGSEEPGYNGRFFYNTTPLPPDLTRGKTMLHCEIRATGPVWGYGTTFEQYQKPMAEPSRGIYRLYAHTDGYFAPAADEKQGEAQADLPVRKSPGPEVLDRLKERVNHEAAGLLRSGKPLNQLQAQFLARAYHVAWTPAYHSKQSVEQVTRSLDATFAAYRKNPKEAQSDPATYNPDWFGLGPSGDAVRLLARPLGEALDAEIDDGAGGKVKRRAAWSEMLAASRDWHRRHRRLYTNQSMIDDLNLYLANRGVAVIDPANAVPEPEIRHYLYESVGLQPWLGSDTDQGPAKPQGADYYQLTPKGLTRELGYVGNYGEVLDWVNQIYDITRPEPGQPGDEKIKAQLARIARARSYFREPKPDAEGFRAMRIETVVGWRDAHYPGDVAYGQRPSRDASALQTAANTLDADAVGAAQQMMADNQFFESIVHQMQEGGLRTTAGLLETPDQYELVKAQPPSGRRLPMTWGQPDFVFSDEQDGVVAIKHGEEIFYASLYWRARTAVNSLARVHDLGPRFDRIAVVREQTQFEASGLTYTRPDWTNMGFANGGLRYPGGPHSAHAGEKLPIAKVPDDEKFKPGDENPYAGRGSFYVLRYGPYLIGMNCTKDKTFDLPTPTGAGEAPDLVSGKTVKLGGALAVKPASTVVLWLGRGDDKGRP